jgi:hypothetical protein
VFPSGPQASRGVMASWREPSRLAAGQPQDIDVTLELGLADEGD